MSRKARTGTAALVLIGGLAAGPIAGAAADGERVIHFRDTAGPSTNVYEPCDAAETVTVSVHGTKTISRRRSHASCPAAARGYSFVSWARSGEGRARRRAGPEGRVPVFGPGPAARR